ncbi:MAG: right-handed parallel beta-helix repeat-containing protein [Polyangiales bacterium]
MKKHWKRARDRSWAATAAATLTLSCEGGAAPPLPPLRPPTVLDECPALNEAPLRNGPGAARPFDCVAVGASEAPPSVEWPPDDVPTAARVYVSAHAPAGGDGTRARPFRTVREGLDALRGGAGAVLVARGEYALAGTLVLPVGAQVVGAGAGASLLLAPRGRAAVTLAGGAAALRGFTLRFEAGDAREEDVGVAVVGGGVLTLEDVRVEDATVGIQAEGAVLFAARVSVLRPALAGVRLLAGSRGVLSRVWVHHGESLGVHAVDSVLHLGDSLITCNGIAGVTVEGSPPSGRGAARCDGDLREPTGEAMCWSRVAFRENKLAAVSVAVCRETTASCTGRSGRITVDARRLSVQATASRTARGGDGISLGPHTRFTLDADLGDDATAGGSRVAGNDRSGILVTGPDAVFSARAAFVEGNEGPGIYVQGAARIDELRGALVADNAALGLGVTPSSALGAVTGTRFLATRAGPLPLGAGSGPVFGDGLALSQRSGVVLTANDFSNNERFAAFLTQVDDGTIRGNRGEGNRYGLVAYSSRVDPTVGNAVRAREAAPSAAPAQLADDMTMR